MSDQFVAEIRMFAGNFAPYGWALCDGQLMPIQQNTALFSLVGTYYGGDGRSTFGLPNLQGCSPVGPGQGPGLPLVDLGEQGGVESVTLIQSELPMHTHLGRAVAADGSTGNPSAASWAESGPPKTNAIRAAIISPRRLRGESLKSILVIASSLTSSGSSD